jgi:hypothetical protein
MPPKKDTASAIDFRDALSSMLYALLLIPALLLAACASVPGETLTGSRLKREVRERLVADSARAAPQCRQQKVLNTEIVEVHPDGKAAVERWTLDECGARSEYRVYFPPTGRGTGFSIRRDTP